MDLEIRAISNKHNIKMAIIDISEALNEIIQLQQTNQLATIALSRTIIANALISLSLKGGSKMTTNINGGGPIKTIIAEFQNNSVRGYVENPKFEINDTSTETKASLLARAVGLDGFLQVSKYDKEDLLNSYTSRVKLVSGEVNFDFMYYLQHSDQIISLITTAVELNENNSIKKACGIIIQLLPGFSDENIDFIEEKIGSLEYLKETLLKTTNYTALLEDIAEDAKVLGTSPIKFSCTCNEIKVLSSIKTLGNKELLKIVNKSEALEVVCDFCKKRYDIKPKKIKEIID